MHESAELMGKVVGKSDKRDTFSLAQGGAWYRAERSLRLTREGRLGTARRAVAGVAVTFIPLIVLAAMEGVLFGTRVTVPLLGDWTVMGRFLVSLPLLILAEILIDDRLGSAVHYARTSGVLYSEAQTAFEDSIRKLQKSRDSIIPDLILLLGAFAFSWFSRLSMLPLNVSSWQAVTPGGSRTLAGRWLDLVSVPFIVFLILRWLWRSALWTIFLSRVARCKLRLMPAHADGAAGLGFLGEAHTSFAAFLMPLGIVVATRGVQWVQYGGGTVAALREAVIAFVLIALAISMCPLMLFMPKLIQAKRRGLFEYGRLSFAYTQGFDQKWLHGGTSRKESLLGTPDIPALFDLRGTYESIRTMRIVPQSMRHVAALVLAVVLPTIPFLAAVVPLERIVKQLAQLVLR